ncbi:MAG: hydrolase [Actinomycetia bacterium]|nr:hydrolase [Actinomycetes bacterium]
MYRAVLFDFGHTLFDNVDPAEHTRTFEAATGVRVDTAELASVWAQIRRQSFLPEELAKQRDLSAELHRSCWMELLAPLDVLAIGLAAHVYEGESSPRGWRPYPDTHDVLAGLAARNVPIGVVSDTGWDIRGVFVEYGLDKFVGTYVMSYEHGATKPAPALFLSACDALRVAPRDTLMVGDNHLTDGGAAVAGLGALVLAHVDDGEPRGLEAALALVG